MKIPEHLKIGGLIYDIHFRDRMTSGYRTGGEIFYGDCCVEINNDMSKRYKEQTFIHEMCHAIMHQIGRDDLKDDEAFINQLANTLYGIVVDNPGIFHEIYDTEPAQRIKGEGCV